MATVVKEALNADQLLDMLEKSLSVDSVELKLMVPDGERMALANLGVDPLQARIRQVYFFDTPSLDLFELGVIMRARRSQNADDDTVVKRRPVEPADVDSDLRQSPNFKLELDATRSGFVISGSMKGKRPAGTLLEAVAGDRPLQKLFTKEQRAFADTLALPSDIWSRLLVLGPMNVLKLKFTAAGISAPVTIEQWHYPGQSPSVEMSVTARPASETMRLLTEARTFLRAHELGAEVGKQESKTRSALAFLSRRAGVSNRLTAVASAV